MKQATATQNIYRDEKRIKIIIKRLSLIECEKKLWKHYDFAIHWINPIQFLVIDKSDIWMWAK